MSRDMKWAYSLLTLTALFWAGTTIVARATVGEMPPLALSFWRSFVAFLLLAPFGIPRLWTVRREVVAHWRILTVIGFFGTTCFHSFLFVGVQYTQAINAALIQGSFVLTILLVAWLGLGGKITPRQWLGVFSGLAGAVTIVVRGDLEALLRLDLNIGDPIVWLGILCGAIYTVLLPRRPPKLDSVGFLTATFIVGSVTTLPLYVWEMIEIKAMPVDLKAVGAVVYVGLFSSVLGALFWIEGVRIIGPTTAGYFIYLTPVFSTLMAITLLGEDFGWYHLAGVVLIFGGVFIATTADTPNG